MAFLEIKDLQVFYGKACAISDISLSVEKGEEIGIIGPNGAGKSSLLDSILGLTDWRGQIIFDGIDIHQLTPPEIVRLQIAYAPERGNLFPFMNIRENLLVGAYCARESIDENLKKVFELFPILKERQKQEVRTLSGGERQMVALAKAFMSNPRLILLDEPTLGLAPIMVSRISEAVNNLKEMGVTILIAEQNVSFTLMHSEEIYLLERGKLRMGGTPKELEEEEYISKTYFGI